MNIPVEFAEKDNYSVRKRYFIDKDQAGKWYLVDASRRDEWNQWWCLKWQSEPAPNFSKELSGLPNSVEFELPYTYDYANNK